MKYYVYRHYYILENGKHFTTYIGKGSEQRAYDFTNRNEIHKYYYID